MQDINLNAFPYQFKDIDWAGKTVHQYANYADGATTTGNEQILLVDPTTGQGWVYDNHDNLVASGTVSGFSPTTSPTEPVTTPVTTGAIADPNNPSSGSPTYSGFPTTPTYGGFPSDPSYGGFPGSPTYSGFPTTPTYSGFPTTDPTVGVTTTPGSSSPTDTTIPGAPVYGGSPNPDPLSSGPSYGGFPGSPTYSGFPTTDPTLSVPGVSTGASPEIVPTSDTVTPQQQHFFDEANRKFEDAMATPTTPTTGQDTTPTGGGITTVSAPPSTVTPAPLSTPSTDQADTSTKYMATNTPATSPVMTPTPSSVYTGGAEVVNVKTLNNGATLTTTASGAEIEQLPGHSAYQVKAPSITLPPSTATDTPPPALGGFDTTRPGHVGGGKSIAF